MHTDVTEEHRSFEVQQRYENILQMMIDTAPVSTLMLDADFTIVFANQRFAEHFGVKAKEIIGAHISELVKDSPWEGHRLVNVQKVFDTYEPLSFIDQENGRWLEHYLAPLKCTSTNDKRVAIFIHDITERIKQEDLEREKIARALYQTVADMLECHEIEPAGFRGELKGKPLTPRESEVLKEVTSGLSTKQIAIKQNVTTKTIESQRLSIMRKLNLFNVADLTKYAIRKGIISLDDEPEE